MLQQALDADPQLLNEILWTDEANFHLNGEVNRHNCRYWSAENPRFVSTVPLHSPKVVVWCGVWSGGLFGPFFFEGNVTGVSYLSMLTDWLLPQLRNLEEFEEQKLVFMQDGAPPLWARHPRLAGHHVRRAMDGPKRAHCLASEVAGPDPHGLLVLGRCETPCVQ